MSRSRENIFNIFSYLISPSPTHPHHSPTVSITAICFHAPQTPFLLPRGHVEAAILERLHLPPHLLRVAHVLHSLLDSHRLHPPRQRKTRQNVEGATRAGRGGGGYTLQEDRNKNRHVLSLVVTRGVERLGSERLDAAPTGTTTIGSEKRHTQQIMYVLLLLLPKKTHHSASVSTPASAGRTIYPPGR